MDWNTVGSIVHYIFIPHEGITNTARSNISNACDLSPQCVSILKERDALTP